jgi:hypothetical protein
VVINDLVFESSKIWSAILFSENGDIYKFGLVKFYLNPINHHHIWVRTHTEGNAESQEIFNILEAGYQQQQQQPAGTQ